MSGLFGLIRLLALKRPQSLDDFRSFSIERSQSALQGRDLLKDVVRVSDRMVSSFVEASCRSRSRFRPTGNVSFYRNVPSAKIETAFIKDQVWRRKAALDLRWSLLRSLPDRVGLSTGESRHRARSGCGLDNPPQPARQKLAKHQ